jgi:hypothetical protein
MPLGPAAFYGAIVFEDNFISSLTENPIAEDKFKFVFAHELAHDFNFLRILVPAFQNWKKFWKVSLDEGCAYDEISMHWVCKNVFIDSYGKEEELLMVSEFWPQNAERWFDVFRGKIL